MKMAPPVAAKGRARIMIADDNKYVRNGVSQLIGLETGLEIVGEAVNGQDAVTLARSLRPDIVIMDINMPVMDGIEATVLIKAERPDTLVVGSTPVRIKVPPLGVPVRVMVWVGGTVVPAVIVTVGL